MARNHFTPGSITTTQVGTPKDGKWAPAVQMLVLCTSPGASFGVAKRTDGTPVILLDIGPNKRRKNSAHGVAFTPRTVDVTSVHFESTVGNEIAERFHYLFNIFMDEFYRLATFGYTAPKSQLPNNA